MKHDTENNKGLADENTAKAIVRLLDEEASKIDDATVAKLASARSAALSAFEQRTDSGMNGFGHVLSMFGDYFHNHRAIAPAAMLCSAMLVAFIATQQFVGQDVVGQGDAFLLGSDLPPEAYFDRGFDTWLAHSSQQQY